MADGGVSLALGFRNFFVLMVWTLLWVLGFSVVSAVLMPDPSEQGIDESKALLYALLIGLLVAGIALLSRILIGSFLDLTFEITMCYLPAVLLIVVYIWMKLKNR